MTRQPYRIIPQSIPSDKRQLINERILQCVNSGRDSIPRESIYNCYTGDGGLHGLKAEDFPSFHAFTKAKQKAENGQFFTPHQICRMMTDILSPRADESVVDLCCGMGNMFNFLPNTANAYGCDIDAKALSVARHLYPDIHVEKCTMYQYRPEMRFDCAIGNPPFNIREDDELSQEQYMRENARVLAPAGILLMIVPMSFMKNGFWEKSRITAVNSRFSFIGQSELDADIFAQLGVRHYPTKIMAFMKRTDCMEAIAYDPDSFVTAQQLKEAVAAVRQEKDRKRVMIMRESALMDKEEAEAFEYTLRKYLWEFKCQKRLNRHIDKANELVTRFKNQCPPENCSDKEFKEWEKKKLTPAKVLSILRRQIRRQDKTTRKETALVRTTYGFKVKQYAPNLIPKDHPKYADINDILSGRASIPMPPNQTAAHARQHASAVRTIARKREQLRLQTMPFDGMTRDEGAASFLDCFTFYNKDRELCRFSAKQKEDLNLVLQKRNCILNWQQGSGKTAATYVRAVHLMTTGKVMNTVILAPAIAVNLTWKPFLEKNGTEFVIPKQLSHLEDIPEGTYVLVSTSLLKRLEHGLKKFMKMKSNKVCLIFDESDEITNPNSQRTRLSLSLFRRSAYKVLATGTTTRNNITELYSQIEMLYNNSAAMTCHCPTAWHEDDEGETSEYPNSLYGKPYPAFRGHVLFSRCHCPTKASVFGIEKKNQDIYNKEQLKTLIDHTVITRKFKDFAGEKYRIINHTVKPSQPERTVQGKIMKEFHRICHLYFQNTGDSRKEAALMLMRQITLLIRSCSVPHLMDGYCSDSLPGKAEAIADLIEGMEGKTAVGCTSLDALQLYKEVLTERFPFRPLYVIDGSISFDKRMRMTREFDMTVNGILLCTQQSLSSSANIPGCDDIILESLQWNVPRMEQFYFRFIRLDSQNDKRVHMVTYEDSIEQNLMALVLTKERLNDFVKTGEVTQQSDIFNEYDVDFSIISSLIKKDTDNEGRIRLTWGTQKVS